MSNRPDWTNWVLEKNAAHEQEELKKSDGVELEKARVDEGKSQEEKVNARMERQWRPEKTTGKFSNIRAGDFQQGVNLQVGPNPGVSMRGHNVREYPHDAKSMARATHRDVMRELKGTPKPDLGKAEDMCPKCKKEPCKCLKKAKDMSGDEIDNGMLMSDIEALDHHIKEIREHMGKGVAPDWVKSKVSRAAAMVSDIAHYIQGLKERK